MHSYREIVGKLIQLNALKRIQTHRAASEIGLYDGQMPLLETLEQGGCLTQKALADRLHVSPASVAVSIKRMQKTGVVDKLPSEDDLRYNRIMLTEKGRDLTRRTRELFDRLDDEMFAGFSAEECEQLYEYLCRMIHNLAKEDLEEADVMMLMAKEHEEIDRRRKEERGV